MRKIGVFFRHFTPLILGLFVACSNAANEMKGTVVEVDQSLYKETINRDTMINKKERSPSLIHFSYTKSKFSDSEKDSIYYERTNVLFLREIRHSDGVLHITCIGGMSNVNYNGNIEILDGKIKLYYWVDQTGELSRGIAKFKFSYEIQVPKRKDDYAIEIIYLN